MNITVNCNNFIFCIHNPHFVKIDSLLAGFLYDNKTLSLEGIGIFSLDDTFYLPDLADKHADTTITGVHFQHDKKAVTDPAIIDYLAKQMGKIKPLVAADVDSHLSLMKQFINLGKPYELIGIGTLNKINDGSFIFTPGKILAEMAEVNHPPVQDHFVTEGFFSNQPKKNAGTGKTAAFYILLFIVVAIILTGAGWGVYTLLQQNNEESVVDETTTDSTIVDTTVTLAPPAAAVVINDSVTYKMVLLQTKWKYKITPLFKTYTSFKSGVVADSLVVSDTLRYRLYIPVTCLPIDTTRIIDSLKKYYNKPIKIAAN